VSGDDASPDSELKNALLESVRRAEQEILDAERELERVIGGVDALPRAQKVTLTDSVRDAFEKLRAAKVRLAEIVAALNDA
jgi:hypothetical protein